MLKRGLMKRLSKSASDLTTCRRKSHSNSPDEEEGSHDPASGFQTPSGRGGTDEEDEPIRRPSSSQSHTSKKRTSKSIRTSSEAAARRTRTVGAELKSQHGFLGLLRQKFGRASPRTEDTEKILSQEDEETNEAIEKIEDSPPYYGPIELPPAQAVEIIQLPASKEKESQLHNGPKPRDSINSSLVVTPQNSLDQTPDWTKSHSKFSLKVHLKRGVDLAIRDSGGTSDPYVKFTYKGKMFYRSKIIYKNLNPYWDETFTTALDDPLTPFIAKVFDYDWALRDDFIGEASVSMTLMEPGVESNFLLTLIDPSSTSKTPENLGKIELSILLVPLSETESLTSGDTRSLLDEGSGSRKLKDSTPPWSATVNVVLVEGVDLVAMDFEGTSDPYCKIRLGNDRYKSKPIYLTLNPRWMEQFDLTLFQDQSHELEITIWDKDQRSKDDFMGRCSVDLSALEFEKTHSLWLDVEEGSGKIFILITVSGLTNYPGNKSSKKFEEVSLQNEKEIFDTYRFSQFWKDLSDVGYLFIKIYCAKGLYAADLGGKSDPFVVLELDNTRLQTHTEYKTVNPVWNRYMTMHVKDIHSALDIIVNDEDRNHKVEFLGRVVIPILHIENGKRRWYTLKDKKCRCRAKGQNPQILIEMKVTWNTIRAALVTLNPKEEKYFTVVEKFKRQVFLNNVMRIKAVIMEFVNVGVAIQSILEWESPARTIIAFIAFVSTTYYFQPYHVPLGLLFIFAKNYTVISYTGIRYHRSSSLQSLETGYGLEDEEDSEDIKDEGHDKEEKKTLKEKLQAVQEVTAMVQNALGYAASLAEGVKNTFNFSVPFLSWLAIIILVFVVLILYFVSLRFLVICWGINKFSKKLIRPNYVPNNELLDFLSRVPDDEELSDFRELSPLPEDVPGSPNSKNQVSKKKRN